MKVHPDLLKDRDERYVPTSSMRSFLDNFFSINRPFFSLSAKLWSPPTDVYETCDSIIIKMEIAGVKRENMSVTTDKNRLIVRGKRVEDISVRKENYHIMEIHYGYFERFFAFPDEFRLGEIAATYENGFLKIVIPKIYEEKKQVKIEIEEK